MKLAILLALSAVGIWYNLRSTRAWWAGQRLALPKTSDVYGWISVGFSALWYAFIFVFFAGLTLNNTIFR